MRKRIENLKAGIYTKTIIWFMSALLVILIGMNYKLFITQYVTQDDLLNHPVYSQLLTDVELIKVQNYGNNFRNTIIKDYFDVALNTEINMAKEYVRNGAYLKMNNEELYGSVVGLITKCFNIENQKYKEMGMPDEVTSQISSILNSDISLFYEELDKIFKDNDKTDIKYNSEKIYKLFDLMNIKWYKVTTYITSSPKVIGKKEWVSKDSTYLMYKNLKNE